MNQTILIKQGDITYEAPLGPDGQPDLSQAHPVDASQAAPGAPGAPIPAQTAQPPDTWGSRVLAGLRGLKDKAFDPENRPTMGGLVGSALGAGPGVALAPETGGLSLLLPAAMALMGGAAGSVSKQAAQGRFNPGEVGQDALHQGEQQMMFGELPAGALAAAGPLATKLGLAGVRSSIGKVLPGAKGTAELEKVKDASGAVLAPDMGAAKARLAENVAPYGKVGSSDAAQAAERAAQVAKDNNVAAAPKDRNGNPLLGFLPEGSMRNTETADQAARVLGQATNAPGLQKPVFDPRVILYLLGGHFPKAGMSTGVNIPRLINNPTTSQMALDAGRALPATGSAVRTFSPNLMRVLDMLDGSK